MDTTAVCTTVSTAICTACKLELTPKTCVQKAYINIVKDTIKPRVAIRYECPSCKATIIFNK